jgi:hypothetical protein
MIVIYSIHNIYDEEIYVGSTAKNYYKRFMEHQYNYNSGNFGCSSWQIMAKSKKRGDVWIEAIEVVDESNRFETEMYWIQTLSKVVNYNNGSFDKANYNLDYQYQNKAKLCERIECSCGKFISRKNISTHKKKVSHHRRLKSMKHMD